MKVLTETNRKDVLPDLLRPGLRVVFCGTGAGKRSAELGFYYAGKGNRFWKVLAEIGLTPTQLALQEWSSLLTLGIGLTDIAKNTSGPDKNMRVDEATCAAVHDRLRVAHPQVIAFNGKKAAALFLGCRTRDVEYGLQTQDFHGSLLFVLPSTSGMAVKYWDANLWQTLAAVLRRSCRERPV